MTRGRALLGIAVLAAVVAATATFLSPPDVRAGRRFLDTDDYTRLLRVRELVQERAWFDATEERANWPHGDTLHWTRPMDLALLAAVAAASPFTDLEGGLRFAATVVPPLLLLGILLAGTWVAAPLGDPRLAWAVPVVLLTQPALVFYARVGRADHHALILLCFAVALGFALRGTREPEDLRWSTGLGLACALGLWTSTEFLLPLALFLAAGLVDWILRGGARGRFQRRWTLSLAAGVAAALLLERGSGWRTPSYDRLSWVHLVVAALAAGVWIVAARAWSSGEVAEGAGGRNRRAGVVLGAAAGAGLLLWLVAPGFFGGPMVEVTDPVVRRWLSQVPELQPRLLPSDLRRAGFFLVQAGCALILTAWLAVRVRRTDGEGGAVLLLTALVVFLGVSLLQVRWVTYVGVLTGPAALAFLTWAGPPGVGKEPPPLAPRIVALGALILAPFTAGVFLLAMSPDPDPGRRSPEGGACDAEAVADYLDPGALGGGPWTVAAHMDLGPILLYRTPHRVLATPYHRNRVGIRAVHDLFTADDPAAAMGLARRHGVDLVVVCPARDRAWVIPDGRGRRTLLDRLLEGEPVPGLRELTVPGTLGAQRVWRLERDS